MKFLRYAVLTILVILLCVISVSAADAADSGNCGADGDNLTWTYYDNGSLEISGSGAMENYPFGGAPWFDYRDGITSVIIMNGVTSIGDEAFLGCSSMTGISIPASIAVIGEDAFSICSSLTSVTITSGAISIGEYAFTGCYSLTSATIMSEAVSVGNFAFLGCDGLTGVTITSGSASIGEYAFYKCAGLKNVTISSGSGTIGVHAFDSCGNLASVTLSSGIASVGDSAFNGCDGLTDIYYNGSEAQWNAVTGSDGNDCLTQATIHYITIPAGPKVVNYTVESGTAYAAVAFEDNGKTAVVSCAKACVAVAKTESALTRLTAVKRSEGVYTFDMSGITGDFELVVALKADANMDGYINSTDLGLARSVMREKYVPDALQMLVMDLHANGIYNSTDLGQLRAVMSGKLELTW